MEFNKWVKIMKFLMNSAVRFGIVVPNYVKIELNLDGCEGTALKRPL